MKNGDFINVVSLYDDGRRDSTDHHHHHHHLFAQNLGRKFSSKLKTQQKHAK